MMSVFWDERYLAEEFVYGREPNDFLAGCLEELTPGKLFLPGEGEGRNAIHAALEGWAVTAFDQSPVAAGKAAAWMQEQGIEFRYVVSDITNFPFEKEEYDAVGLVFFHLPPPLRKYLHEKVIQSLKPGGHLIIEAFHKKQIGNGTGGPGNIDMLYDRQIILADFQGFRHELLKEITVPLKEGRYHQGKAKVLRYLGIKN
jgi:SAM-dependent methyltransferase